MASSQLVYIEMCSVIVYRINELSCDNIIMILHEARGQPPNN